MRRGSVVNRFALVIVLALLLSAIASVAVAAPVEPPTVEDVRPIDMLQTLILVVLQVAIPPLLAWGIAELKRYIDVVKTDSRYKHLHCAASNAVAAAEQLGLTGQLAEYGNSKLRAAMVMVENHLAAAGVPLDVDQYYDAIRAMIEAEVRRQFPHEEPRDAWESKVEG